METLRFVRDNARWLMAGALLSFLSSFGQTFFVSVFGGDIRAEFGLSHGQWGMIYTAGTTASAAVMVWAGTLADRIRIRVMGAVVLAALALACFWMSVLASAVLLPVLIFALRFAGQGMLPHLSSIGMARWFAATRGRALAIAGFGFIIGEAALPVSVVALKQVLDWHLIWRGAGVVALLAIPVLYLLLSEERTPQSIAKEVSSVGMDGRHWTRGEALRHPLFLSFAPGLMAFPALATAFWFQQVHYAEIKGLEHLALVAVFPLGTGALLLSLIGFGMAIDRYGTAPLLPLYLLPLVLAFACYAAAPGLGLIALGVILSGIAGGGQGTLPAACWAEFFGTAHLGAIKSAVTALMVLGSAIGPALSGLLIDAGVSFTTQLWAYAGIFLATVLILIPAVRSARQHLPTQTA